MPLNETFDVLKPKKKNNNHINSPKNKIRVWNIIMRSFTENQIILIIFNTKK